MPQIEKVAGVKYDVGFAVSPAIGYRSGKGLVAEGELKYMRFNAKFRNKSSNTSVAINILSPMLNIGYEPDLGNSFTGYAKIGVGYAHAWASVSGFTIGVGDFTYQGIVGASYGINENSRISLDYRHVRFRTGSSAIHQINLGYTHRF